LGVDLGSLISRKKVELENLSNWKIAVDAYNTLYQFLAIIRGMGGEQLRDSKGRVTSHLSGLFYRNINLMELNIKLVYVFDGKPPELKAREIEMRRRQRRDASEQYARALSIGDFVSARKYAEASTTLEEEMVPESKKLLDAMGIPWIDAPSEGEAQAAIMAQEGIVDAVASQDHDSLLFGSPILARNITISGKRRLPNKNVYIEVEPETISLAETLKILQITKEQLVDLGILVGTDFNPEGFKGIGPARALKLIKTYGSLERVEEIKEELANVDHHSIRQIFLSPPAIRGLTIRWSDFQPDYIKSFLVDEHSFSADRVNAAIERLHKSSRSDTLEKWFS
jgi:flap endonuclease-1